MKRAAAKLAQGEKLIYQKLEPKAMSDMGKNGKKLNQGTQANLQYCVPSLFNKYCFLVVLVLE